MSSDFPLPCEMDHRIFLLLNSPQMNVTPYRCLHLQKSEVEKLVGKILAEGANRPSTSPFLLTILPAKRKDVSW